MEKKITVRDVAREAGVSVATVSYIMNNRTDQKISEDTRKKVLQIANLLNYKPSSVAKSLATGCNGTIGIAYHLDKYRPSRSLEISNFMDLLIERLNRLDYDVLFMPYDIEESHVSHHRHVDGIIAIDLSNEAFLHLSNNCLVPVISVDMLINDSLFYQIYTDIPFYITKAREYFREDFYLILDQYENEKYMDFLMEDFPSDRIVCYSNCNLQNLEILKNEKVLIIGSYLALFMSPYIAFENAAVVATVDTEQLLPSSCYLLKNDVVPKANLIINILLNALNRKFDVKHDHKLTPENL